jgi:hypothetical protein
MTIKAMSFSWQHSCAGKKFISKETVERNEKLHLGALAERGDRHSTSPSKRSRQLPLVLNKFTITEPSSNAIEIRPSSHTKKHVRVTHHRHQFHHEHDTNPITMKSIMVQAKNYRRQHFPLPYPILKIPPRSARLQLVTARQNRKTYATHITIKRTVP